MGARTVVVTDSTSCLSADEAARRGVRVVPLQVVFGDEAHEEGSPEASPEKVAAALRSGVRVSTSRVAPEALLETYREIAATGATDVISVHLSGAVSGTYDSAQVAAREARTEFGLTVHTVDTRQVAANTGFAVQSACDVLEAGGSAVEASRAARRRAALSQSYFYVDTLEYLRRGGRVSTASAILGGALAVKPLLTLRDGKVVSLEKVRTAGKALGRLADLLVTAAGGQQVDLCIAHLDAHERAEELARRMRERLAENLGDRDVTVLEVGGVVGAHVGPGMVAGAIAPLL